MSHIWAGDMSTAYDEFLVPAVFSPFAEDLADRVARHQPVEVLELAAGTGVLTRAIVVRLPQARVTATDVNLAMVEVGEARVPEANWRQVDAMELPFDDASFDVVACQFGVMFLPDKSAAYAGVARVLRQGGRFVFNTWSTLSSHEVEAVVIDALAEAFPDDPPRFLARIPHGYHDAERVAADLTSAGFDDVTVETVQAVCSAPSAADLAVGYCRGTPLRPEIEAHGDPTDAIRAVTSALEREFGPGPVVAPMEALVASAAV